MTSRTWRCEISKKLTSTLGYRPKIHHFFFSHKWDTRFKYLSKLCPYILMYSALHIMQWFSHSLDVFTPKMRKSDENFSIFTFYESKQTSLTQDLKWSLNNVVRYKYSLSPASNWFVTLYYIIASSIEVTFQTWPLAI